MNTIYNNITKVLSNLDAISNKDLDLLIDIMQYKEYDKSTNLITEGETERYISFIHEGIVKSYCVIDKKEIIFNFTFADDFVSSYASFITGEQSEISIATITKCKLLRIPKNKLEELYKFHSIEHLSRKICELLYVGKVKREHELLKLSATERYKRLLAKEKYFKMIPLKDIAKYLGIHPESLSRIRKNIT